MVELFSLSHSTARLGMLFYDYFMVYGTNTIGEDHDEVESFSSSASFGVRFFHVVLTARTQATLVEEFGLSLGWTKHSEHLATA